MIIWLASYPKSGNTWTRILISQLISGDPNDLSYYENSKIIRNYPLAEHFKSFVQNLNNREQIIQNWVNSQKLLSIKNKIQIFKTHNILGSFGNYSFTNKEITLGVIHVVRDPRNVISSVKNHFSLDDLNSAKEFIFDKNKWIGDLDRGSVDTFISSWKYHYLSWKSFNKNYLLIKYEDLLKNTKSEVLKIYSYLKQFYLLNLDEKQIDRINEIIKILCKLFIATSLTYTDIVNF